ncbi:MAG TPA: hypothetical protein VGJ54_09850 [Streptosporangiaceae bacterium]
MTALSQARVAVRQLTSERPAMRRPTAEEVEAAAGLLADLWPVAARHGITPGSAGWSRHLPRAALDAVVAARRPKRGGHKREHGPSTEGGRR